MEDTETLLTTKDTKDTKVRTRRNVCYFVFFVTFVVVFLRGLDTTLAQTDISEADLIAVSNGRTLRIGSTTDGHVSIIPLRGTSRALAARATPGPPTPHSRRSRLPSGPTR